MVDTLKIRVGEIAPKVATYCALQVSSYRDKVNCHLPGQSIASPGQSIPSYIRYKKWQSCFMVSSKVLNQSQIHALCFLLPAKRSIGQSFSGMLPPFYQTVFPNSCFQGTGKALFQVLRQNVPCEMTRRFDVPGEGLVFPACTHFQENHPRSKSLKANQTMWS